MKNVILFSLLLLTSPLEAMEVALEKKEELSLYLFVEEEATSSNDDTPSNVEKVSGDIAKHFENFIKEIHQKTCPQISSQYCNTESYQRAFWIPMPEDRKGEWIIFSIVKHPYGHSEKIPFNFVKAKKLLFNIPYIRYIMTGDCFKNDQTNKS